MPTLSQLFKLRGELPPNTFLLIEIIGMVLILVLWQLIAGIGSTKQEALGQEATVYYNHATSGTTLEMPYVLLYDRSPIRTEQIEPILKSLSSNNIPLLLVTGEPNQRALQFLSDLYPQVPLIGVKTGSNKAATYERIGNFTGATLLDATYFADTDSTQELATNLLGRVHTLQINADNTVLLQNRQELINNSLLPSPIEVVQSFRPLLQKDNLLGNTAFSIYLNLFGYLLAVIIALPLGFVIGLFPVFRALFNRNIDALRFVPLTAVTGLFIAWFGIETKMKVAFLAFGIIVYLLPVVVLRVREVEEVYVQTAYTLGANKWQQIKTVFIPAVLSRISDDIRVLVAISWTYIIVAELVNANSGGIGALAFKSARQSSIDKVFAILLVIIVIGFIQDKLFLLLDRVLFPYKAIADN